MVYVLDTAGKPLMPTERHGKVRKLLRDGKAHVVRLMPFTIQLDYESKRFKQEVSLGVDAGSVHIGVSATTEKKELFSAEFVLRNDIVKKMASRKEMRRTRRSRNMRYRVKRYDNRSREKGWLYPSVSNKVDGHVKIIRIVHSILPINKTVIEVAQFDVQKIKNDKIQGVEYQQGEQLGFWNVREYVLARDGHKCQHCKGKSGDKILNVHHMESRKTGGNAPNNLITLCETCHKAYHRGEFELNIKRGTSLRDAAAMNIIRYAVYERAQKEFRNIHLTYGYITKYTRIHNSVEKTHNSDAFCITMNVKAQRKSSYYKMRCIPRHTRSLHVCNPKKNGIRRNSVVTHWVCNKLQKYDFVEIDNKRGYIFGSTHNYPIVRDIDGKQLFDKPYTTSKNIRLVRRKKSSIISIQYEQSQGNN